MDLKDNEKDLLGLLGDLSSLGLMDKRVKVNLYYEENPRSNRLKHHSTLLFPSLDEFRGRIEILYLLKEIKSNKHEVDLIDIDSEHHGEWYKKQKEDSMKRRILKYLSRENNENSFIHDIMVELPLIRKIEIFIDGSKVEEIMKENHS